MLKLISFGYKYGQPPLADLLVDVRFLQNPHWVKTLKPGSGLDPDVGAYIEADSAFAAFFADFKTEVEALLNHGHEKTIAAGCTGGRHRSVYVMEKLAKELSAKKIKATVKHRDLKN